MFVRDEGVGPVVVLIHGLGASSRVFDAVYRLDAGRHRMLAFDLPSSGRSAHWSAMQPEPIAAGLLAELQRRGVRRCQIFAHSFGGLVALTLATSSALQVTRLSLASVPALGLPAEAKWLLANPMSAFASSWIAQGARFRPALSAYVQLIWGTRTTLTEAHVDAYFETAQTPDFGVAMLEGLRALASYRLPIDAVRGLGVPIDLHWGERDRLVLPAVGEHLALSLGAKLEVLHDVGHCFPDEAPDVVLETINR